MALTRRSGQRFQTSIWPGFVDAMTALLLVLMFVLSIFMIVQFILRETITGQESELHELSAQVASLADALGLERLRARELEGDLGRITASLEAARSEGVAQASLIERLTADLAAGAAAQAEQAARLSDFEAEVARLLVERDSARGEVASLSAEQAALLEEQAALLEQRETLREEGAALREARSTLESALAAARTEIDAGTEAARLAAARREALEALIADLRRRNVAAGAETERLATELSEEEAARLAEAEAARLLRERLEGADTELTAMTMALEAERKRAEDTLTLLAAAEVARADLEAARAELEGRVEKLTELEQQAALLAVANARLADEEAKSAESQRQVALLNEQIAAMRAQLGALQAVLDEARERDREANVQIEALGSQLNVALAQVAAEQRARAELEEAERIRLEAEAAALAARAENLEAVAEELEKYRSEFFGRLREILGGREGVRIVGDRFVFSSEVLFETGSAELASEGQAQIASVALLLLQVAAEIPPGIDWILRVDGHTDAVPVTGGRFADNWELSQARALSVVRYMTDELGFPPARLAATGFGEYQPVAEGDSPEALAQNRRIEMKLTER